ncbi:unnamed protein product [Caenorhabditis sp. 36 PRJEB53466]|nr:unnamed protein product [Caenorhabditis sp. 36 PRJEB53466]
MNPIRKLTKTEAVVFLVISNTLFFSVPIFFIILGICKWNRCSAKEILPIGMIVTGFVIIIDRILFWRRIWNETKYEKVFPRPEVGSMNQLTTWEEKRKQSSSNKLWYLMAYFKIMVFVSALLGAIWTYGFIFKAKNRDQCDALLFVSTFSFSVFTMLIFLVGYIGIPDFTFTPPGDKLDQIAVAALDSVS